MTNATRLVVFTLLAVIFFVGFAATHDAALVCLNNVAANGSCLP